MKTKHFLSSIRWKLIGYFILSAGLAFFTIMFLLIFGYMTIRLSIPVLYDIVYITGNLSLIFGQFGPFLFMFLIGSFLVFVYFLLLTRGLIRNFEEVSNSLSIIADGDLGYRVSIDSNDELGTIADNINQMTSQLEKTIKEERQAQQTKYELITNVSHDLRTPLTSIMGYLDLIEEDKYRDEVELRHYTQVVYSKAKRLQKLIEDLFEYTKLHGGGVKINKEDLDIGKLIDQLVTESFPIFQEADMECRTYPSDHKLVVEGDGNMLARVFENLLSNASRYGKDGKYVDIKWTIEKVGEREEAVIEIINYGPPIPSWELPHIFERFYRVEKSRSEDTGGTGLGLAITKNMVELNDGKITAHSDYNKTSFEVRLKLKNVETNVETPPETSMAETGQKQVDDKARDISH